MDDKLVFMFNTDKLSCKDYDMQSSARAVSARRATASIRCVAVTTNGGNTLQANSVTL